MDRDEINALVTDWAHAFDVKLTATQHMGLQLELRKKIDADGPCLHDVLRGHPYGLECAKCRAIFNADNLKLAEPGSFRYVTAR